MTRWAPEEDRLRRKVVRRLEGAGFSRFARAERAAGFTVSAGQGCVYVTWLPESGKRPVELRDKSRDVSGQYAERLTTAGFTAVVQGITWFTVRVNETGSPQP